jgi:hypothetical protein
VVGRCVLPENSTLGRGTTLSPFYLGQAPAHPTGGHDKYQVLAADGVPAGYVPTPDQHSVRMALMHAASAYADLTVYTALVYTPTP